MLSLNRGQFVVPCSFYRVFVVQHANERYFVVLDSFEFSGECPSSFY